MNNKKIELLLSLLIGILIISAPIIITGHLYNVSKVIGSLLVADFVVRTLSLVIGLIVIKTYFK